MGRLEVEIVTPSSSAWKGEADVVTLPGSAGEFQVLFNHAPIMSTMDPGKLKIKDGNSEQVYAIGGGFAEVKDNRVLVLAESIEKPEDIDVERAKEAAGRAKERLSRKYEKGIDVDRAEVALKRAVNRLKISGNY